MLKLSISVTFRSWAYLTLASKKNVIDKVSGNSEFGAQIQVKSINLKNQNRKTVKFKFLIKSNHDFSSTKGVGSVFLNFKARLVLTKLKQVFVKASIFYYFNSKCHIQISIDESSYTISEVLCKLTSNDSNQLHPVVFFLWIMISIKRLYETDNGKLLGIVEVFKI